jgi:hypothetical protein
MSSLSNSSHLGGLPQQTGRIARRVTGYQRGRDLGPGGRKRIEQKHYCAGAAAIAKPQRRIDLGRDSAVLLRLRSGEMLRILGREIVLALQSPLASLNPTRIGA